MIRICFQAFKFFFWSLSSFSIFPSPSFLQSPPFTSNRAEEAAAQAMKFVNLTEELQALAACSEAEMLIKEAEAAARAHEFLDAEQVLDRLAHLKKKKKEKEF